MADEDKNEDFIKFFLILGTIISVSIVTWIYLHVQISSGIRWIRVGQIYIINLFSDHLKDLQQQLIYLEPSQISVRYIIFMTEWVMNFFKIPITVILALYAVASIFLDFDSKFTRKFGLEKLIEEHAKAFPVTTPITKFNPIKSGFRTLGDPVPSQMKSFAEALAPEEWVAYKAIPMPNNELELSTTRQCFLEQLGRRWRGVNKADHYVKALYVAFSMKANGLRRESDDFLSELAKCWSPKTGLRFSKPVRKIMKEHIDNPKTGRLMGKIALRHAFTTTAMLRLLQEAREKGGVLASAQFIWLRDIDRNLWYALNNLGRNAVHIESAGAMAHYRAENSVNRPIPNPRFKPAIEGLVAYLKENGYTGQKPTQSIPARDYRGEKSSSGARAPV